MPLKEQDQKLTSTHIEKVVQHRQRHDHHNIWHSELFCRRYIHLQSRGDERICCLGPVCQLPLSNRAAQRFSHNMKPISSRLLISPECESSRLLVSPECFAGRTKFLCGSHVRHPCFRGITFHYFYPLFKFTFLESLLWKLRLIVLLRFRHSSTQRCLHRWLRNSSAKVDCYWSSYVRPE